MNKRAVELTRLRNTVDRALKETAAAHAEARVVYETDCRWMDIWIDLYHASDDLARARRLLEEAR